MQSDQLLRRTGLAHQDKVRIEIQTGQVTVTVTHNGEERRQDGWQREGEAPENRQDTATTGRRARVEGGGRPAANDRGWRRWRTEGPEGRWQGEWPLAGGLGTRRSVSLPRDRGHVIGHARPW